MIKCLTLNKRRKLLGAVVVCVAFIAGAAMLWQLGHVAEAAVLDPHPGLVGWWSFDEEAGSVATDTSGYENDVTIYGATLADGKYGGALDFNGANDYARAAAMPSFTDKITVELWLKLNGTKTEWETLLHGTYPTQGWGTSYWLAVKRSTNSIRWRLAGTASPHSDLTLALIVGQWYHIVGTYDGSNAKIFVNGNEERTWMTTGAITGQGGLTLGIADVASYAFQGVIDEVRIWNRALSAAEIEESFERRPGFSSKLLAKIPTGTTKVMATLSWQGIGSANITVESPSKSYTEDTILAYEKTVYSTSDSTSGMLNIKRLSISPPVLSSEEDWYLVLEFDDVEDYKITVEVQR